MDKTSSLFWCHAVVTLQFNRVYSFASLRGLTWERFFSGVSVYCVTISWQQILKGSLQVTVEGILPHVAFEHWCHA